MHSNNPDRLTRAARRYVSPRTRPLTPEEAETRAMSYLLKDVNGPAAVFLHAAGEMAALIHSDCNLIPAPDRHGDTLANTRLAYLIAGHLDGKATVYNILGRTAAVESSCERHKAGLPPLSVEDHRIIRTSHKPIPCRPTFIVDNVTTNGTTIAACTAALGFGTGLVFADAYHTIPN